VLGDAINRDDQSGEMLFGDPHLVATTTSASAGKYYDTGHGVGARLRCNRSVGGAVCLVVHWDIAAPERVVPVAARGVPGARAPVPELGRGGGRQQHQRALSEQVVGIRAVAVVAVAKLACSFLSCVRVKFYFCSLFYFFLELIRVCDEIPMIRVRVWR